MSGEPASVKEPIGKSQVPAEKSHRRQLSLTIYCSITYKQLPPRFPPLGPGIESKATPWLRRPCRVASRFREWQNP